MLEPTDKKQCSCYLYKRTVVFAAVKVCDSEPWVTPPSCGGEDCIHVFCWTERAQASQETQTKAIHQDLAASHSDERYCMSLCAFSEQSWPLRQNPHCAGQNIRTLYVTICNSSMRLLYLPDIYEYECINDEITVTRTEAKEQEWASARARGSPFPAALRGWLVFAAIALHLVFDGIHFIGSPSSGNLERSTQQPFCPVRNLEFITVLVYLAAIYSKGATLPVVRAQSSAAGPVWERWYLCVGDSNTQGRELIERACCWKWTTNCRLHLQDLKASACTSVQGRKPDLNISD